MHSGEAGHSHHGPPRQTMRLFWKKVIAVTKHQSRLTRCRIYSSTSSMGISKPSRLCHFPFSPLHRTATNAIQSCKMSLPVSIGDAYLIAKLALKLGRAFTKGRKSAPTEFREVENQLYSLSAALSALDSAIKLRDPVIKIDPNSLPALSHHQSTVGEEVVRFMLKSCEETLKHLKKLVEAYGSIGQINDPESPMLKRWGKEIKDNWKKVKWTTEGGDLATLRSQLTVHTNSLNLLLGVINK